jgi:hypothetical protein
VGARRECRGYKGLRVRLVSPGHKGCKGFRACRGHKELKDPKDRRGR